MNREQARQLVRDTFTHAFQREQFRRFAKELVNRYDESKAQIWGRQYILDAFKDHIDRYERVGTYSAPDGEKLDILIVYLTKESKLERARTALRNFVAHHLKSRDDKDAGLVAFVSPTEQTWRFSFVRMEYETELTEAGVAKAKLNLTSARRFSYLVGESESCHTAQSRFLDLLKETGKNPTLEQIAESFSVETVTKEFFNRYYALFQKLKEAVEKIAAKDKLVRDEFCRKGVNTDDFAKKLLGQIVFLYFIQKKGWLGVQKGEEWGTGPRDFLRRLARGDYGKFKNIFNDVFEPLFYDTLATDRGAEAWCATFKGRIPFLNGGLCEPISGYHWRATDLALPNELFFNDEVTVEGDKGTGVLDVFDRYNFTVNEAEPLEQEVAIDPEMLGKVFENLLEAESRKSLGTFYTPREIVHYMCQQSLISYLYRALNTGSQPIVSPKSIQGALFGATKPVQAVLGTPGIDEKISRDDLDVLVHSGDQAAHYEAALKAGTTSYEKKARPRLPKSIEAHAKQIEVALRDITVCDPAIGSGAFPVGMMTEIVRARLALNSYFESANERTAYHFKRHAIQSCLYGVDIDWSAVEIAKLRLWLSLVVDEEDPQEIRPLPNLDFKIVAGNSLLGFRFQSQGLTEIEKLKNEYFDEPDHDRKNVLKEQIDRKIGQHLGVRPSISLARFWCWVEFPAGDLLVRQGRARAVEVGRDGQTPPGSSFSRPAEASANSSNRISFLLSMAEGVHLQYVVRQANQRPFAAHLLQPAQEKPSHPAPLFDLTKHRLDDPLALGVNLRSSPRLQFAFHPLQPRCSPPQGSALRWRWSLPVLVFLRGDVSLNLVLRRGGRFQRLQILLRTIAAVGQHLLWPLPRLLLDRFEQRLQLLFVVRRLRHRLPHDQLTDPLHRRLRVVGLQEPVAAFHDARFRIAEVVLILVARLRFADVVG